MGHRGVGHPGTAPSRSHPSVLVLRLATLGALAFSVAAAVAYLGAGHPFCQPGGGCDAVRASPIGDAVGDLLPIFGVLAYSGVFAGSLIRRRGTLRAFAGIAALGGLAAGILLVLQGVVIGAWCGLCVGVDSFGMLAGLAGVWVITSGTGDPEGSTSLASPWWGLYGLAFAPLAIAATFPDPATVPDAIRALYDPSADVNVVEMADFECPYCRRMNPVIEAILEEVDGEVHLVRLMVPLSFHPHARGAAAAYFCAQRWDRGESMASRLFEAEDLRREGLLAVATDLSLDRDSFEACLDDPAIDERIENDLAIAERAGMQGLPTVYIGERVVVGFAPGYEATYREAVVAAQADEGRRVRVWPIIVWLGSAALAGVVGARARRRGRVSSDVRDRAGAEAAD